MGKDISNPDSATYAKEVGMARDVFKLVMFLENKEKTLRNTKKELLKMLTQDPFQPQIRNKAVPLSKSMNLDATQDDNKSILSATTYQGRKVIVKNIMCPLGKDCPSHLKERWPTSDVKSTVPVGAFC